MKNEGQKLRKNLPSRVFLENPISPPTRTNTNKNIDTISLASQRRFSQQHEHLHATTEATGPVTKSASTSCTRYVHASVRLVLTFKIEERCSHFSTARANAISIINH